MGNETISLLLNFVGFGTHSGQLSFHVDQFVAELVTETIFSVKNGLVLLMSVL